MSAKDFGDFAETYFEAEAKRQGFIVYRTPGDNLDHDFVIENRHTGKFYRVQVKATHSACRCNSRNGRAGSESYIFQLAKGAVNGGKKRKEKNYVNSNVDVFAFIIPTKDLIFLVPIGELKLTERKRTIRITPGDGLTTRWAGYQGVWSVFGPWGEKALKKVSG